MTDRPISPGNTNALVPPNPFFDRVALAAIALALCAIGLFGHLFDSRATQVSPRGAAAGFPLDDAWIHQVYARSLAEHGRFDYNEGQAELGSSSPAWTTLLAPLHWLGEEDTLPRRVRFVGMLSWIVLALAAANLARRLFSPAPRTAAAVAAWLVALRPEFGFAAGSGMEPLLCSALSLFALERALVGRAGAAGILASLACVTRPEALAVGALVIAIGALFPGAGLTRLGAALRSLLALAPFPLAWSAFCSSVSGRPLPNTFYAKAESVAWADAFEQASAIFSRLLHDCTFYRSPTTFLLIAMGFVGVLARAGVGRGSIVALAPLGWIAGVAISRPLPDFDAFYWTRYSLPAAPFLDLFLAVGIAGALSTILDLSRPTPTAEPSVDAAEDGEDVGTRSNSSPNERAEVGSPTTRSAGLEVPKPILSILLFVLAILPFVSVADGMRSSIERFAKEVADVDATNVAAARFLANESRLGAEDVIAAQDAGAARYFAPCRVIDILGLNDHRIVSTFLSNGDVGRYLSDAAPKAFFLLDPDPGAQAFLPLAQALGLTPLHRFAVSDYSVLGPPLDKGIVLYLRPSR